MNKTAVNSYLSIMTLYVNGLNAPIKRKRMSKCILKQGSYICYL